MDRSEKGETKEKLIKCPNRSYRKGVLVGVSLTCGDQRKQTVNMQLHVHVYWYTVCVCIISVCVCVCVCQVQLTVWWLGGGEGGESRGGGDEVGER